MNTQINLRLSDELLGAAKKYSKKHGYNTVQEFIKEALRERLFDDRLTRKEEKLIERLIKVTDKHNLWVSEEELFKKLKTKSNK